MSKGTILVMKGVGALVLGVLALGVLASCQSTGTVEKKRPIAESPLYSALLNPNKLTPESRQWLEGKGMRSDYRRDPGAAIATLYRREGALSSESGRAALAELCANTGDRVASREPLRAVGFHLTAAQIAFADATTGGGGHDEMRVLYNHSAGRVAELLFDAGQSWSEMVVAAGPVKSYRLRTKTRGTGIVDPGFFDELVPADYLEVNGVAAEARQRRAGIGGAMVGHRDGTEERRKGNPFLARAGMSLPVSAVLDFGARPGEVELVLYDGMVTDTVRAGGRTLSLAVDFTAPLVTLFNYVPKGNVGFEGMLHPDKYADNSELVQLEPFRPDQIPVVLVHGLMSSPETWTEVINRLRADPVVRENYQVLAFYYPTGFPIAYNAEALRNRLRQFREHYDPRRRNAKMGRMVLVGHSMGGLLTNLQIRDSGDALMKEIFAKPVDEIALTEAEKEAVRELALFEASPDVDRAVFIAAPHRGSDIASGPIGQLGSALIKIPRRMTEAEPLRPVEGLTEYGVNLATHRPDGVTDLRPNNEFLMTVLEMPVRPGLDMHSVIARHKPEQPLAESSDMLVPYWSSHLDDVDSEKVVHATHTTITGNEDSIEEVRRILYIHLGRKPPRTPIARGDAAAN